MKTLIVVLFASSVAFAACPKNSVDMDGICAAIPNPSEQALAPAVPTSDEKPSKHPESAWERGEVHAEMPPVETAEQEKANIVAWDKKAEKDQR